jgi:hypothetical protein
MKQHYDVRNVIHLLGKNLMTYGLPYGYGKRVWNARVWNVKTASEFLDSVTSLVALGLRDPMYHKELDKVLQRLPRQLF